MTKRRRAAQTAPSSEAAYTREELVAAHWALGWNKECVQAALRYSGRPEMSLSEAQRTVDQFMRKAVD